MKNILNFDHEHEGVHVLPGEIALMDCPVYRHGYDKFIMYPVMHGCTIAIIILKGGLQCTVSSEHYDIQSSGVIIILPDRIMESIHFSHDFDGRIIVMSASFTSAVGGEYSLKDRNALIRSPYLRLEEKDAESLVNYYNVMRGAILQGGNPYRKEMLIHLNKALDYSLGYYLRVTYSEESGTRKEKLSLEFIRIVRNECRHHHDIGFYADALCISAKYLDHVVRSETGKAPGYWIREHLSINAKSMLSTTDMTACEVGYALGFNNPSDFGKFFRNMTGLSPLAYRRSKSCHKDVD